MEAAFLGVASPSALPHPRASVPGLKGGSAPRASALSGGVEQGLAVQNLVAAGVLAAAGAAGRLAGGRHRRRAAAGHKLRRYAIKTFSSADGEEYQYDTQQLLGEGGQGSVYQGSRVSTGETVAVKAIPVWRYLSGDDSWEKLARIDREARKQLMLGEHPNIARLHALVDVFEQGTTTHPQYKMLVMELIDGKELAEKIKAHGPLAEPVARHVFKQVLDGVAHIHGLSQIHRDLKLENILVTGEALTLESQVKIIDFGVTRNLGPGETFKTLAGTGSIRPPEIAKAKISYMPSSQERKLHTAKFRAPSEEFPGFGLASRTQEGYGACLHGVEDGSRASAQGLQDGWIVTKIGDTAVNDMLFQAAPDVNWHTKVPKIVNLLMELSSDFTMELVELPPREFSRKVDLWALGVVLYAMLAGKEPFQNDLDIIESDVDQEPLASCSPELRSLLSGLLEKDPTQRLSLEEVQAHPWMTIS